MAAEFYRIYDGKKFRREALHAIATAKAILDEFAEQGFDLTLRQLYYQFVARDMFPDERTWRQVEGTNRWVRDPNGTKNAEPNYKWLGDIVNDGRMAGYLDWNRVEDRTRNLKFKPEWDTPVELVEAAARQFNIDLWADQPIRPEVWIEKDALVGVIEDACRRNDVDYFACRGYVSQSEMWRAGRRIGGYLAAGQKVTILHLGDHDPSGIDMTRDIEERILRFLTVDRWHESVEGTTDEEWEENFEFVKDHFNVNRIALNMDQIVLYDPPPNPAKLSDARGARYVEEYGPSSWELDALSPTVIDDLIQKGVDDLKDTPTFEARTAELEEQRLALTEAANRWDEVVEWLG